MTGCKGNVSANDMIAKIGPKEQALAALRETKAPKRRKSGEAPGNSGGGAPADPLVAKLLAQREARNVYMKGYMKNYRKTGPRNRKKA